MTDKIDKIYDLVEKVYVKVQDLEKEMSDIKNEHGNRLSKIELTLENVVVPNFKMLFETQTQILEKLDEHDERFDRIEKKLDNHDVEIRVIQGGKKSKSGKG